MKRFIKFDLSIVEYEELFDNFIKVLDDVCQMEKIKDDLYIIKEINNEKLLFEDIFNYIKEISQDLKSEIERSLNLIVFLNNRDYNKNETSCAQTCAQTIESITHNLEQVCFEEEKSKKVKCCKKNCGKPFYLLIKCDCGKLYCIPHMENHKKKCRYN